MHVLCRGSEGALWGRDSPGPAQGRPACSLLLTRLTAGEGRREGRCQGPAGLWAEGVPSPVEASAGPGDQSATAAPLPGGPTASEGRGGPRSILRAWWLPTDGEPCLAELEEAPLTVKSDMAAVVRVMQLPDSGLEIRDRMWLKITIANAVIGEWPAGRLWAGGGWAAA